MRDLPLSRKRQALCCFFASSHMQPSMASHSLTRTVGDGLGQGRLVEKMNTVTFAEKFCAKHCLPLEKYEKIVLSRSLYPAARLLRPVLVLKANYFAADHEFVLRVGRLMRLGGFEAEVQDFLYDPNNRGFLRRVLKLRVSARRLRRVVRDLTEQGPSNK
jgi:hypothetical protein